MHRLILVVGGPAGTGKTTVASYLSQGLDVPYLEGDNYHPATNKIKMGSGIPLTDDDRWDWLGTLREEAQKMLHKSRVVIVTCSVLKRKYRDVFRAAGSNFSDIQVHFLFLRMDETHLQARVKARVGHYMKETMVRSQLECLEDPAQDEFDVSKIDGWQNQDAVCRSAMCLARAKVTECENDLSNHL